MLVKEAVDFFKNGTGWCVRHDSKTKDQDPGSRLQASSTKFFKLQATSVKPQATSFKLQAPGNKLPDSRTTEHGY